MRWSYLPLARTRHKSLTCDFATPQPSRALVHAPKPSAQCPRSLHDRLNEGDIADLITAYRQGATAASLAAAHGLSLTSVKHLLHIAGRPPESPTQQALRY